MTRRIAVLTFVLAALGAVGAWAGSAGFLIGDVEGKTTKKGLTLHVVFDATNRVLWNVYGSFPCPDPAAGTVVYTFSTNGIKPAPTLRFDKQATITAKAAYQAFGSDHRLGTVKVTFTATLKKTKDYTTTHNGRASGTGTVTFSSKACKVAKTIWKGSGPFAPN